MACARWMMVFGLGLALLLGASRVDAASGKVIDLDEDANGFQLWYAIGGGGLVGIANDVALAGSIGQPIARAPDPLEELAAAIGFWSPAVSYDTTDVDPSDSTEVMEQLLDATDGPVSEFSLSPVFPNPGRGIEYV